MKSLTLSICLITIVLINLGLSLEEDDIVFEDVSEGTPIFGSDIEQLHEIQQQQKVKHKKAVYENVKKTIGKKYEPVEKLLGLPDAVTSEGRIFKYRIHQQAFSGSIDYYEIRGINGMTLAPWLAWDEPASTLYGVPTRKDIGRHRVNVKAYGKRGDLAQDSFLIHVLQDRPEHIKRKGGKQCQDDQDLTMLTLYIDAKFENVKPNAKVNALENLAGFLGEPPSIFSMKPEISYKNVDVDSAFILSGPGNVGRRKEKHTSLVQWQVGCDGHFWPHEIEMIKQIPEQAKDGTLSEVMQLPVYMWRIRKETTEVTRSRRETGGSGDGMIPYDQVDDDEDEYDDDNEDDYDSNEREGITDRPVSTNKLTNPQTGMTEEHHRRHHHGDVQVEPKIKKDDFWAVKETDSKIVNTPTPVTTTPSTESIDDFDETTIAPPTYEATIPTISSTTTTTTTTSAPSTTSESYNEKDNDNHIITVEETYDNSFDLSNAESNSSVSIKNNIYPNTTSVASVDSVTYESTSSSSTSIIVPICCNETAEEEVAKGDSDVSETTVSSGYVDNSTGIISLTMIPIFVEATSNAPPPVDKLEANATSLFTVNSTTLEETTEESASGKESSPSVSTVNLSESLPAVTPAVDSEEYPDVTFTGSGSSNINASVVLSSTTTTTTSSAIEVTDTTGTTTSSTTTTSTTTTTTTPEPITFDTTTPSTTTTTITSTTTTTEINEERNIPPRQERRLKKIAVTAGKPLSYLIPEDTFFDFEDGGTRNLKLNLYLQGAPLKSTHWLQFNHETQEVYGLPLESDASVWDYEVVATDREGLKASDRLDIHVQQHKLSRAVNHEFSIYLKIEKKSEFPTNVDWELKVMKSLAELYGDKDISHITVRSVDMENDQAIFTWTNDSLPRQNDCPQEEINKLFKILTAEDGGEDPSEALIEVLSPQIRIKRVVYQGIGQCEELLKPEGPKLPTQEPTTNLGPIPRNQVDQLKVNVGQLLVFRVPEDTFYDAQDGNARNMKMSLLTYKREEIPPGNWLQFDPNNQEFYGVPMDRDTRHERQETYHLVVKDKEGLEATDSLVVIINRAPNSEATVKFTMILDMGYEEFANKADKKRRFIEKLRNFFNDRDTSNIEITEIAEASVKYKGTTVTWRNVSLPTSYCPENEIKHLSEKLIKNGTSLTEKVEEEFSEFLIRQINVNLLGKCASSSGYHIPDHPMVRGDSTAIGAAAREEYFYTFLLPAIVIAAMIILAGTVACILYKRRRSGKMSISEKDEERQSFRNKGIPVIFQDELDEKPDPGNKSPIILKEEKPPLPPPEYQRAEDGADIPMLPKENSEEPYQPPPPFPLNRDNNRLNRPKPTPTYRKPPPYVPP